MNKRDDSAYRTLVFECPVSSGIEKPGIVDKVLENMELDHFVKSALPFLKGPGRKPRQKSPGNLPPGSFRQKSGRGLVRPGTAELGPCLGPSCCPRIMHCRLGG